MTTHQSSPPSASEPRLTGWRRPARLLAILVSALLGSALLVVAPPTVSALEEAPGGGGGYCPAEFHSCPSGGSWCTWYGTCPGDIGGYNGGGGAGGGSEEETEGAAANCGREEPATVVDGWIVKDLGTCSTIAICLAKRNAINAVATGASRAYCWANWNIPNSNGRHLVFAQPANG